MVFKLGLILSWNPAQLWVIGGGVRGERCGRGQPQPFVAPSDSGRLASAMLGNLGRVLRAVTSGGQRCVMPMAAKGKGTGLKAMLYSLH